MVRTGDGKTLAMRRSWISVLVLVAAAVALGIVIEPSVWRAELARWKLAAAANALEQDRLDEVPRWINDARELNPNLESEQDYWYVLILEAYQRRDYDRMVELIAAATAVDQRFRWLGEYMALRLARAEQFLYAARALEATITDRDQVSPETLNAMAYWRALAGADLDQALQDIERALKVLPDDPALRDTRAWVLFQMGRPLEALADAQFAVETMEARLRPVTDLWQRVSELLRGQGTSAPQADETAAPAPAGESPPGTASAATAATEEATAPPLQEEEETNYVPLLEGQVDPQLWSLAVLKYHRARILEALGRIEEAQQDYAWLRQHRLPTDDRLH